MDPIKKIYQKLAEGAVDKCYSWYQPGKYFRCSESSKCVTALWYRIWGYRPQPRTPVGEMYGTCGDLDHDLTRQLFEYAGAPVSMVTQLPDGTQVEGQLLDETFPVEHNGETYEVRIKGRSDGEIETDEGRVLLEIKGTGFYPYLYLRKAYEKSGIPGVLDYIRGTEARPANPNQLAWYAQMQVSMGVTGHKHCYLVVKDRATGTVGFYKDDKHGDPDEDTRTGVLVPFDQEFFDKTLQRFAYVLRKLDEREPPKPEFLRGSKNCKQCDMYYLCHGKNEDGSTTYPGPGVDMDAEFIEEVELDADARLSE